MIVIASCDAAARGARHKIMCDSRRNVSCHINALFAGASREHRNGEQASARSRRWHGVTHINKHAATISMVVMNMAGNRQPVGIVGRRGMASPKKSSSA